MQGNRDPARTLFERAYECQQTGDLPGAILLYQASIAAAPSAEAHTFLGWVYGLQRRYHEAIAECKKGIAADPTFGNPYNDIGVYLMELGQPDQAIPWLRRAMNAPRYDAPHFPHVNLARIHEERGQILDALRELTRARAKTTEAHAITAEIHRLQAKVN